MNSNDTLMPTNISNIISNFSHLVRNFSLKDTEWQIQKEEYEKRISELEGELKAHENINIDLLKRIRMLEYALLQERQKNSSSANQPSEQNDANLFNDLAPQKLIKEDDLKFLKERVSRPSLMTVLQSIGIDENLAKNLFDDFELNRTELEAMIKRNLDEKLSKAGQDNLSEILQKNQIPKNEANSDNQPQNLDNLSGNTYQQQKQSNNYTFSFNKCIELRSHLDEVRKLTYLSGLNSLVSVSEDCLIKVWSLNNIFYNSKNTDIEPYLTLRGHTGPLYCTEKGKAGSSLIYTGGNEGLIQIWNIPKSDEVPQYGESESLFNLNVGFFQKKEEGGEIIWDLKHHPIDNLLISLSSDATINFWHTKTAEEYVNSFLNEEYLDTYLASTTKKKSNYVLNNKQGGEFAIPTTCEFLSTDSNKLIVGFDDACISIFDIEKENFTTSINTLDEKTTHSNKNRVFYQPNCLTCANTVPIIYGGFEDNTIKIMDIRNNRNSLITNSFNAHSDAVTRLNLLNDIYLFSISHDTTIKMWDTRKLNDPVVSIVGSQKKWDEAMWDSLIIESMMMFCVACADCTVKLYKL